jgi:hypothetical protein
MAIRTFTGTGAVQAMGGNGVSAVLTNAGGGGGGGGGTISIVTENDTTTTSLTFSVNGGAAGGGQGTGVSGNAGSVGRIYKLRS